MLDVDALAQEIRRVDGSHSLGAGELAEALMPFIARASSVQAEPVAWEHFCDHSYYDMWCVRQKDAPRVFGDGYHVTSEAEAKSLAERLSTAALAEREPVAVAVKQLEWTATRQLNRNDYHGSKPFPVEYKSKGVMQYVLSMNWQTGGSWDATRGGHTPIKGGTCVSLEAAKAAAQADYGARIRSALVATPPAERVVEALTDMVETTQKLGEFDLALDRNAYPRGPMAEGRGIYRVIGWEGADRGGLLLSDAEAEAIRTTFRSSAALAAKPAVKDDERVQGWLTTVTEWLEGGCSSWGVPVDEIRLIVAALAATEGQNG